MEAAPETAAAGECEGSSGEGSSGEGSSGEGSSGEGGGTGDASALRVLPPTSAEWAEVTECYGLDQTLPQLAHRPDCPNWHCPQYQRWHLPDCTHRHRHLRLPRRCHLHRDRHRHRHPAVPQSSLLALRARLGAFVRLYSCMMYSMLYRISRKKHLSSVRAQARPHTCTDIEHRLCDERAAVGRTRSRRISERGERRLGRLARGRYYVAV